MPRFLLHHIIFDHGLVDGLGPDQPGLQGTLLCRKDWIQLREIARSDCVILPVQEVAAYPWCTPWYQYASKVDGPCTGCPDSTRTLGVGPQPPLSTQPIVPFQPELPSQELPSQPRRSFQRCHLTGCDSSFGHSFRSMQRGTFARPQHFGSVVVSRRSGTEPPREEIACAGRPVGTQCGREGKNPGGHCGTARPWRDGARTVARAGGLRGPALANTVRRS